MERVTVRMSRGDRSTPWGFGVTEAPNRDVIILNVVGGSLADRAGLRNGDVIETLEDLTNLDINAVDRLLVTSRDKIELVVHRQPSGEARVWRPDIQATEMADRPYKVNLQHTGENRAPAGFNSPAVPFDPRVKHLQYNSPMGLYSNENVAESYVQQTQAVTNGMKQMNLQSQQTPAYLNSETLRVLKEQEAGRSSLGSHPNPNNLPVCFICTRPILGVMARVGGQEIHGDCLKCSTCGNSLRNIGHHLIDGKLYCDIHGQQRKGLSSARMNENLSVRTTPTYSNPVPIQENVRAAYQPEGLRKETHVHVGTPKTQGPISPSNRGVPTNTIYADRKPENYESQYKSSVYSQQQAYAPPPQVYAPPPQQAPPPPPANPPPVVDTSSSLGRNTSGKSEYHTIPQDVRAAVSPRMKKKKVEWPPREQKTVRYWQIGETQTDKAKESVRSLVEMIGDEEVEKKKKGSRMDERRKTTVIQKKEPPVINNTHWTVISGPPKTRMNVETAQPQVEEPIPKEQPRPVPPVVICPAEEPKVVLHKPEVAPVQPEYGVQKSAPVLNFAEFAGQKETPSVEVTEPQRSKPEEKRAEPIKLEEQWRPIDKAPENSLAVKQTVDCSTSPIPVIHLHKEHQVVVPRIQVTQEVGRPNLLIGINTVPKPFGSERKSWQEPQEVHSASPVHSESPKWKKEGAIVDEMDIVTVYPSPLSEPEESCQDLESGRDQAQRGRDLIYLEEASRAQYDGDVSELMDEEDEWMREELEIARKEELENKGLHVDQEREQTSLVTDDWSREAMKLLNDEDQNERDLVIVAALNERLQGFREMEECDRERAIEVIRRYQMNLEEQQDQLGTLLHSAINYLRNFDSQREEEPQEGRAPTPPERNHRQWEEPVDQRDTVSKWEEPEQKTPREPTPPERKWVEQVERTPRAPTPPERKYKKFEWAEPSQVAPPPQERSAVTTESLSDVMAELESIPFPTVDEKLSKNLRMLADRETDSASFTRSTFERNEKRENVQSGIRKEGSLNTTTGRVPVCEACKQNIRGAFVLATGLAWCPEHFVCANGKCGRRLLECGFVEENGEKYCEQCFESYIAPRCNKCTKPIISDCLNALQKKWHPTCFTCAHCHKPFGNAAFYLENGLAYCEQDWNSLFTTKCVNCNYAIEAGDRWVEALGSAFHSNCFNCTRCHINLEGESFFAKNGQPFCKQHA